MISKDNAKKAGSNGRSPEIDFSHIKLNPATAIKVNTGAVNSYGLDLTDLNRIGYQYGNIQVEVSGGIQAYNPLQLRVGLRINKKGVTSSKSIFRNSQVDIFNDDELNYAVRKASEETEIESEKMREALYDLATKLDHYLRDSQTTTATTTVKAKSIGGVKKYLKQKNLLIELQKTIETSGVPDGKLGLKLFLLGLSRITDKPLHTIIQGPLLLSNEIVKSFACIVPDEQHKEATSISKQVLSYPPSINYWDNKLLVLHQLDASLGQKNSALEEYLRFDRLQKLVTEVDHNSGKYYQGEKYLDNSFSVMGYTNKDYYSIFNAPSVVCLPLCNTSEIQGKLTEKEIRKFAGLTNSKAVDSTRQQLINIQRHLQPANIINPHLDVLHLHELFNNDVKKIKQFLQITNMITLVHQEQLQPKKKDGVMYYEVEPEHMEATMDLFKELWVSNYDEIYFQVAGTLNRIKGTAKKECPKDFENYTFKEKEMREKVGGSPSTFNKHLKKLCLYNKLERVSGNNRTGFDYKIVSWKKDTSGADQFQQLKTAVENLGN